jgi:hypothetical protein
MVWGSERSFVLALDCVAFLNMRFMSFLGVQRKSNQSCRILKSDNRLHQVQFLLNLLCAPLNSLCLDFNLLCPRLNLLPVSFNLLCFSFQLF